MTYSKPGSVSALAMDRVRYAPPALNLFGAPETGTIGPTVSIRADLGSFADNESGRGSLCVIPDVEVSGHIPCV